ncbi:MAG: spermidine synthase [Gemmatimonadaceae bacterium]
MMARARPKEIETSLSSRVLPLIAVSVFLSAALLFLLQPMFGKMILPMFGGAPAVWITSLVFFQIMLLAGYLYVHVTSTLLDPRKQAALHAVLLFIPLVVLPIHILNGFGLTSPLRPISSVFLVLLASVGLPFFVVSTTAPLLQRWFGSTRHKLASDPFFLYAASNLGSIGALLLYPIVVEPHLALDTQARAWSIGYGLLIILSLACAFAIRSPDYFRGPQSAVLPRFAVRGRLRLRWVALAAVPSSLLLSVTSHITTDIAPVPLFWVIPLTLYLLTFVFSFSPRMEFLRRFAWNALPFVVFLPLAMILNGISEPPGFVLIHLAVFFIAAMVCHGELAATRPGVAYLTEFYVWLAVGGAVGGLFNVVVAPIVFHTRAEYPLGLILACLLRATTAAGELRPRASDIAIAVGVGVLTFLGEFVVGLFVAAKESIVFVGYAFTVPVLVALIFFRRPLRFALAVATISLAAALYPDRTQLVIASDRSFYGVHRVVNRGAYRVLLNGNTHHGSQSLRPPTRCVPLSYYHPTGPLGDLFATFTGDLAKSDFAVIGLGTGSTGGYARPGQRWTFYEIDPAVERIARNPEYFTFLRDCVPQARVVIGDARLSLTSEPDSLHDLLVVDAFSSDAIPVHLLTREAMDVYTRKLAPRGVIAFHISNRYVNLRRILARLARDANLVAYVREDRDVSAIQAYEGKLPSVWVMMARTGPDLGALVSDSRWLRFPPNVLGQAWTDNYSNVFETLKLHI